MFSPQYFSPQYFAPVWFAPGDESHLTPEETYRPTDAGMAPTNLRFEPIRDADALLGRVEVSFGGRTAKATGEANAHAGRVSVLMSSMGTAATGRVPRANGYARPVRGDGSLLGGREVYPVGDSHISVARVGARVAARSLRANADAVASASSGGMWLYAQSLRPRGVLNPSDEELLLLVRRRMLTRTTSGAKTRAWIPRY